MKEYILKKYQTQYLLQVYQTDKIRFEFGSIQRQEQDCWEFETDYDSFKQQQNLIYPNQNEFILSLQKTIDDGQYCVFSSEDKIKVVLYYSYNAGNDQMRRSYTLQFKKIVRDVPQWSEILFQKVHSSQCQIRQTNENLNDRSIYFIIFLSILLIALWYVRKLIMNDIEKLKLENLELKQDQIAYENRLQLMESLSVNQTDQWEQKLNDLSQIYQKAKIGLDKQKQSFQKGDELLQKNVTLYLQKQSSIENNINLLKTHSQILDQQEYKQILQLLEEPIPTIKTKQLSLIYRSSHYNYQTKNFLDVCSRFKGPYMIIVQTKKGIIGQFIPDQEIFSQGLYYHNNNYLDSQRPFSFSLKDNKKNYHIQGEYAYFNSDSYGPYTGSLQISNEFVTFNYKQTNYEMNSLISLNNEKYIDFEVFQIN